MAFRFKSALAAGAVALFSAFTPATQAETFKVTFSAAHGPQLPWIGMIENFYMPEVDKRLKEAGSKHNIVWNKAFSGTLAKVGGEGRLRVLVLDLELRNATTPTGTPAEPPPPLSPWTMAAMGTGGLAALSLVVGIGADVVAVQARNEADARNPDGTFVLKSADAAAKYETEAFGAAFALGGYIGAGVLVAATAGLIAVDAME